jgi:hypothetical protein
MTVLPERSSSSQASTAVVASSEHPQSLLLGGAMEFAGVPPWHVTCRVYTDIEDLISDYQEGRLHPGEQRSSSRA